MSASSLLFMTTCWAMYRLGAFNERHPGEALKRVKLAWKWIWSWMNQ